jgi:hypothetical protein
VEEALEGLADRDEPLVVRLERQPGQKEARYAQLLGGAVDAGAYGHPDVGAPAHAAAGHEVAWREEARPLAAAGPAAPGPSFSGGSSATSDRLAALEARLAAVEADLAILGAEHRELREELGLGATRPAPISEPD